MMNPSFFSTNRQEVTEHIKDGIILIHSGVKKKVSTQESYGFRPNKMFYYLTGLSEHEMVVVLFVNNAEVQEMLFIPEKDPERERWEGKGLDIGQIREQSSIQSVYNLHELAGKIDVLLSHSKDATIWLNVDDNQPEEFKSHFNLNIPADKVQNIHPYLSHMRKTKQPIEIEGLKRTIQLAVDGVIKVMKTAKEGIYEYELEAIFDYTMKSNGLKTGQYHTILASGKNATILHYIANDSLIQQDELILIDIDVEKNHYHCDFTRVFPASGKFTERQKEIYEAVLSVQKEIISAVRPGITYGELNAMSKKLLWMKCKELGLDTVDKQLNQYYFHNIGHFIGLDTHDVGELTEDSPLTAGMVLTIEPGLYIASEKVGIRIEDMIAVTEEGHENLTKELVKEVADIEYLISKSKGAVTNEF